MSNHLMNNYQWLSPAFVKGEGSWLIDEAGNRYLDAIAGIAVCGLGHANERVARALSDQVTRLMHTSNLYHIPLQVSLAEKLTALSNMDKVFFCNSGAEANEAAIKLTRLYARGKDIAEPVIIVAENSFHGRTMATLSATGNEKIKKGFEPLVSGFLQVPYNDIDAIVENTGNSNIVAVMLEPVQGEGGINIPDSGYLKAVRQLCDDHDWLLICDEIQTGMCRTGKWFAYQHEGICPDVMTLAKALGNGFPIGACLARGQAADLFRPGSHGSTYGGNPLACRAGLTVIEVMTELKLDERASHLGKVMLEKFRSVLSAVNGIVSIRGKGLMLGIELDRECTELVKMALNERLLINVTSGNVIRLLPALTISDQEADQVSDLVIKLTQDFLQ